MRLNAVLLAGLFLCVNSFIFPTYLTSSLSYGIVLLLSTALIRSRQGSTTSCAGGWSEHLIGDTIGPHTDSVLFAAHMIFCISSLNFVCDVLSTIIGTLFYLGFTNTLLLCIFCTVAYIVRDKIASVASSNSVGSFIMNNGGPVCDLIMPYVVSGVNYIWDILCTYCFPFLLDTFFDIYALDQSLAKNSITESIYADCGIVFNSRKKSVVAYGTKKVIGLVFNQGGNDLHNLHALHTRQQPPQSHFLTGLDTGTNFRLDGFPLDLDFGSGLNLNIRPDFNFRDARSRSIQSVPSLQITTPHGQASRVCKDKTLSEITTEPTEITNSDSESNTTSGSDPTSGSDITDLEEMSSTYRKNLPHVEDMSFLKGTHLTNDTETDDLDCLDECLEEFEKMEMQKTPEVAKSTKQTKSTKSPAPPSIGASSILDKPSRSKEENRRALRQKMAEKRNGRSVGGSSGSATPKCCSNHSCANHTAPSAVPSQAEISRMAQMFSKQGNLDELMKEFPLDPLTGVPSIDPKKAFNIVNKMKSNNPKE